MDILFYLIVIALLALGAVAIMWVAKGYLNGQSPTAAIFGARPERRLGIIEQANVDGRRRLLLIRRDNVEHLLMIGGPTDVVVEPNIVRVAAAPKFVGLSFVRLSNVIVRNASW